jgi:hypothetical protein
MKQIITIANSNPWCPYCEAGNMSLLAVTHETFAIVAPDVEFLYGCSDCHKTISFTIAEMEVYGTNSIGITLLRRIAESRPK